MIEESEYCSEVMKNFPTKKLRWLKKTKKILRTLQNVGYLTMIMLIMILK